MMSSGLGVLKSASGLAKPLLKFAREQWHRRGASLASVDGLTVDRELSEAIALLRHDEQTAAAAAAAWLKATLSGRPPEFDEPHVKEWLRLDEVEALLKDAARAHILEQPFDQQRDQAGAAFHAQSGDHEWYGGALFDTAVAFLVLTLDSKLTPSDRVIGEVVKGTGRRLEARIDAVDESIASRLDALGAKLDATAGEFPTEVVAEHLRAFVNRESRLRSMVDPARVERILGVALKALEGTFRRAPHRERADVFRLTAATLAREDRPRDAEPWLEEASRLTNDDLTADRARVTLLSGDVDGAITALRDRHDAVSASLLLDAIQRRDGHNAAIDFYRGNLAPASVTGFGLSNVAIWAALERDWVLAEALFASASVEQIAEHPLLLLFRARFRLATMLPEPHRAAFVETIAGLPQLGLLRNDQEGERLRGLALADLAELGSVAAELRHEGLQDVVATHAMFLHLISPDATERGTAEAELLTKLADPSAGVPWASLALTLRVPFDPALLRARLARAKSLGRLSAEELLAAAQLTMRDRDGDEILAFVDEHRERLAAEMTPELAFGLEIEVLAKKGRVAEARERLEAARGRLGPESADLLAGLIAEEEGEDGVALRLAAFEATGSDRDLDLLVEALVEREDSRAGDYAADLWRMRHRAEDAVTACNAYFNDGADEKLDAFIAELGDVIPSSKRLREHLAWSHFRNGHLREAQTIIDELRPDESDRQSLRQLEINVAIEGGDWHRLSPLLRQDLDRREHRSARQLIQAAGLAHAASDPLADELARAAVAKAPDDPHMLIAAFSVATRRGRDWEPEPGGWLQRAIELSDGSGPLQRGDLRDVVRMKIEGDERARDLDRLIMAGEVPLGLAARPLNTSLSELILARLAANVGLRDARRRLCLPLIAGNRLSWDISRFQRVALDPAAILTLQLVGLLEEVIAAFPHIILPAGTFPLLLNDLERAARGQPSRAAQALKIKGMIADGRIEVFPEGDGELIEREHGRAVEMDGVLIHTAPLYEPGSFMEREHDPSAFEDRLAAPQAVVRALRAAGEITAQEESTAVASLAGSGPDWPNGPKVDLAQPIVVDGASLHMLDHAGMLDRLVHAGARLHVPSSVLDLSNASVAEEQASRDLSGSIERVRATLHAGLASGKVSLGAFRRFSHDLDDDQNDEDVVAGRGETEMTPLYSMLRDGSTVDLLVSGERVVNRHGEFTDSSGTSRPVATPWDVVEHLRRSGHVDEHREAAARRKMREAGVALLPVSADELVAAAAESDWSHGASRALKAICQSVQLALVRRAVSLPNDGPWLASLPVQFAMAIRRCWAKLATLEGAKAAAEYLFQCMPDAAGHAEAEMGAEGRAGVQEAVQLGYVLLASPVDVPQDRRKAFREWHVERVERRLLGQNADLLPAILERLGDMLTSCEAISENGVEIPPVDVARFIATGIPRFYLDRLTRRADVRHALGLGEPAFDVAGHHVAVAAIASFLTGVLAGSQATLADEGGTVLCSGGSVEGSTVVVEIDGERHVFTQAMVFSPDATTRRSGLDETLEDRSVAPSREARWRDHLAEAVPTGQDFMELIDDLGRTPEAVMERMLADPLDLEFGALVPKDRGYFANLIGVEGEPGDLDSLIANLMEGHAALGPTATRLVALGPLAVAQSVRIDQLACNLSDAEAATLARRLLAEGDAFSAIAAFEVAALRGSDPECRSVAMEVADRLLDDEVRSRMAHDLCIGAMVAMRFVDRRSTLAGWPLGARRLAAMTHAGHIARFLGRVPIDRAGAWEQVTNWVGAGWPLAGLLDRADDGEWIREWLEPPIVSANMLFRLSIAMGRFPDAPDAWTERLIASVGAGNQLFALPGPMDALDSGAERAPLRDAEEMLGLIEAGDPEQLVAFVAGLLTVLRPPADIDGLIDVMVERTRDADGEVRDQLIDNLLRLAAKFRLERLADLIWNLVWEVRAEAGYGAATLVNVAVASAAVRAGSRSRERCEELLVRIAAVLSPGELLDLIGPMNAVATTPGWANTARRGMNLMLLGMDGRIS